MTDERLKKIKDIFEQGDIYGDDNDLSKELYNEVIRLREELNGKEIQEMHKINNYDYFKEMTENWNREDFSRRCYDLCNEMVELQAKIDKAIFYLEHNDLYENEWIYNKEENKGYEDITDEKATRDLLNILNGSDKE